MCPDSELFRRIEFLSVSMIHFALGRAYPSAHAVRRRSKSALAGAFSSGLFRLVFGDRDPDCTIRSGGLWSVRSLAHPHLAGVASPVVGLRSYRGVARGGTGRATGEATASPSQPLENVAPFS